MIDCERRCVVPWSRQEQYAALSYVWGGGGHDDDDELYEHGRLKELPLTIEDALSVTRNWGLRYIWVDRYCIDFRDETESHSQISQMNLVYQNAELGIIAAAGDDANFGLPGISTRSRSQQPSKKFGDWQLVSTLTDPKKFLEASKWMKRGWTYQEGFFSPRRLIFTEEQVVFDCRAGIACESLPHFHTSSEGILSKQSHDYKRPWTVIEHLIQYSGRELSFESDAIKAFMGVFNEYSCQKWPVYQYFGIPVMPRAIAGPHGGPKPWDRSRTESFAAGLCWRSSASGIRRKQYPTWSWAGWNVPLAEKIPECAEGLRIEKETGLEIFVEDFQGSLKNFEHLDLSEVQNHTLDHHRFIHLEAWTLELNIQHLPDTKEWISVFHRKNFPPDNCSEYFAVFEDETTAVHLALMFLDGDGFDGTQVKAPLRDLKSLSYGIVLGRCESAPVSRGLDGIFIMVVQERGDHFERVGHMVLRLSYLRMIPEPSQNIYDHLDAWVPWQLCFRSKKRRRLRIG